MKTMKNNPITVLGNELKLGDKAPEFTLVDNALNKKHLSDFKKEYVLISIVPSLDTGVCDFQTRHINERIASLNYLDFITVSMDLPFAQARWCGASGLTIETLSDHMTGEFGVSYGVLIKELRLLARAAIVLNQKREVIYVEYLKEMSNHPNYDKLLDFIATLE